MPESLVTLARAGSAADILLTIGGASVGDRDLVASALKAEGLELDFWKIAMRPGKPLLYGRLGSQRVLGLAGESGVGLRLRRSSSSCRCWSGCWGSSRRRGPSPRRSSERRCKPMASGNITSGAVSEWREDGTRVVRPLPSQDSSLVAGLAHADCLIVRAPHAPALPQGARVRILPLERRLRGRKPESPEVTPPAASYRILWHSCLRNTNRTDKLFMICTSGRRNR